MTEEAEGGRIFFSSTGRSLVEEEEIVAQALGAFIERQYREANVEPDEIDTGALILTGVAVRRRNARRIGELFAHQAGKMVAVSAGDSLETVMAAHGSGAAARSIRAGSGVMNVDVGGGTSKIAICAAGRVNELTAPDVGARLVCLAREGRIARVEEAGGAGVLRLPALAARAPIDELTFSGGVAEYIYGREAETYGDLGVLLAQEVRARAATFGARLER